MIFIKFYPMERFCLSISSRSETMNLKTSRFRPHFILPYNRAHRQARAVACFPSLLSSVASRHNLTASSPKPSVYNWSILNRITYTIWFIYVGVARAHAHTLHRGMRPPPLRATCILISNIRYRVPTHQCAHGPPRTMHLHPMDRFIRFRPRLFRSFACRRMEGISGR